ncbi:uncharacterized protein [Primulina eburnea]|uniref:uncharacterized protein n=1 Tax=Primulina eburnea TaxID=1245227 RepID=UPI003C6CAB27
MDVASDDETSSDNIDLNDYDLSSSFNMFYTEEAFSNWSLYANRALIEERNADMEAFSRKNLIEFLKSRGLLSTVSSALPYCHKVVLEFYVNLSPSISDARSPKFGRVFVRNRVYNFEPQIINDYYGTPVIAEGPPSDLNDVISTLTGGPIRQFPAHPAKVLAANLTSLYSVLHKIVIRNWTPTTNTTVVTKSQALTLFAIGNSSLNFGRPVFYTIMQYAHGGLKSSKLPFLSLIYGILESQVFIKEITEHSTNANELLKIVPALFKGKRNIDLPWIDSTTSPPTSGPFTSSTPQRPMDGYLKIPVAGVQSHLDHVLKRISQAKADLAYYEDLAADLKLFLEVGVFSEQKGRDLIKWMLVHLGPRMMKMMMKKRMRIIEYVLVVFGFSYLVFVLVPYVSPCT